MGAGRRSVAAIVGGVLRMKAPAATPMLSIRSITAMLNDVRRMCYFAF
jgi:hypothetical protein